MERITQVQVLDVERREVKGKPYAVVEFMSMQVREAALSALHNKRYGGNELLWARDSWELNDKMTLSEYGPGNEQHARKHLSPEDDDNDTPLASLARPTADLSSLATTNPTTGHRPDQIWVTHTISQDLTGTADEVMSLRLAALAMRERG